MMHARAAIPRPARGYDERTRSWWSRIHHTEPTRHLYYLNQLMMRGRAGAGWLNVEGELLMLGCYSRAASLEGFRDHIHPAGVLSRKRDEVSGLVVTDLGAITWYPLRGAQAAEGSLDAHVDFGILATAWPGVTALGHSIGVMLVTNLAGNYFEAGAAGLSGTSPIALRGSSGFRGGVWLAAPQVFQGNAIASGWSMGSRTSAALGFGRASFVHTDMALAAANMPNQKVTLLSIEPGAGNSPNRILVFWLGGALTPAQALQQEQNLMTYIRDIGTWDSVDNQPLDLGTNAFGPHSLAEIVPADFRVYRQSPPPSSDAVAGSAYAGYPLSGVQARFFLQTIRFGPLTDGYLVANPIQCSAGSAVLTITHANHALVAGRDTVELAGAVPSNGLADGDLNRRFLVETTPTANTYTVTTGHNATAALAIGGASVHAGYRTFRDNLTTFSFPRDSRFDCLVWSNRATVLEPGDPPQRSTRPNVGEGATINRRKAGPGGAPPAGIECRPGYDTKRRAAGSTVVQFAFVADVLPRNDARILTLWDGDTRPSGWGYLDIAEKYDLDPAKVLTWAACYVGADDIFTTSLGGFALSHDVVILQNGRMSNVPNVPLGKKGITIDLEHADYRAPELTEEMLFDCNAIGAALGFSFNTTGHYLTNPQGLSNGFVPANIRRIQSMSNFRGHNLIAAARASPAAMTDFLQAQADCARGPDGTESILWDKFMMVCVLGVGQSQVPLDQCDAVAAFMSSRGIKTAQVRRWGSREGGLLTHIWNQQQIHYFPNLTGLPPQTAQQSLDAWAAAVIAAGGATPTTERQGLVLELMTKLVDAAIWPKLEVLTVFANETAIAARVDWKSRVLGTLVAPATLVADRWLLADGVSGYFDHAWAPSSSLAATAADQAIAVYVKDEIGVASVYAAGSLNTVGTSQMLRINPDAGTNITTQTINGSAGFEATNGTYVVPEPGAGLYWAQRNGGTKEIGREGTLVFSGAITTAATLLATRNLLTGAYQNNGTPAGFKAGKRLATVVGKHLAPSEWQILADALTVYFTAIGAMP